MTDTPVLLASCWTTAGDARPLGDSEASSFELRARIEAAAAAGYRGFGLLHADLRVAEATIGLKELSTMLDANGMAVVEVEMLNDWFAVGAARDRSDAMRADLLRAAETTGARHLKVGGDISGGSWPLDRMAQEFHDLCTDAEQVGTRVAFEIMPFGNVATLEAGVALVDAAGHPRGGLMLDLWHIARGGTPFDTVGRLASRYVTAVELDDADEKVVGTLLDDTLDRRRLCGQGDLDVPGFIRAVRQAGFDGPWGVEILSDEHRARGLEEQARLSFAAAAHQFELAG